MGRTGHRKVRLHIKHITELFDHVQQNPFYTEDVVALFNPSRMHMLAMSGMIEATGKYRVSDKTNHSRRLNEWRFTSKGVHIIDGFRP